MNKPDLEALARDVASIYDRGLRELATFDALRRVQRETREETVEAARRGCEAYAAGIRDSRGTFPLGDKDRGRLTAALKLAALMPTLLPREDTSTGEETPR